MVLTQLDSSHSLMNFKLLFPYHYGSHATSGCGMMLSKDQLCFHTTMVLTQRESSKKGWGTLVYVSIPLWFSRNPESTQIQGKTKTIVSIPLWFSRNYIPHIDLNFWNSFHTTMVLTQRGMLLVQQKGRWMFPYHYGSHATGNETIWTLPASSVSIPLWFSRNSMSLVKKRVIKHDVSIPLWFSRNLTRKAWDLACGD